MNKNIGEHCFHFGKNWSNFNQKMLNPEREKIAYQQTLNFLQETSLKGKTVIDIGCGSGLFSLVFYKAGADKIISFDSDKEAVNCTLKLREKFINYRNWHVLHGDILNDNFIKSLGTFDIVYAWGSLHHTGNMHKALENAIRCVNKNGLMYISIYNKVPGRGLKSSSFWEKEKRFFNSMPPLLQKLIFYCATAYHILNMLLHFKNPVHVIKNHKNSRGMNWFTDLLDWLGGFPYEYASVDEIFNFFYQKNFELINIKAKTSLDCNEFLFRKK